MYTYLSKNPHLYFENSNISNIIELCKFSILKHHFEHSIILKKIIILVIQNQ